MQLDRPKGEIYLDSGSNILSSVLWVSRPDIFEVYNLNLFMQIMAPNWADRTLLSPMQKEDVVLNRIISKITSVTQDNNIKFLWFVPTCQMQFRIQCGNCVFFFSLAAISVSEIDSFFLNINTNDVFRACLRNISFLKLYIYQSVLFSSWHFLYAL